MTVGDLDDQRPFAAKFKLIDNVGTKSCQLFGYKNDADLGITACFFQFVSDLFFFMHDNASDSGQPHTDLRVNIVADQIEFQVFPTCFLF